MNLYGGKWLTDMTKAIHPLKKGVPKGQAGLFVSEELQLAIKECQEKVEIISKSCRAQNRKFRDSEFDIEIDTELCLFGLKRDDYTSRQSGNFRRVTEIFDNPSFFVGGPDTGLIYPGSNLLDTWFLSALATISTTPGLIEKICVARDEQVGIYGFIFFRDGNWVNVVVDDHLCWTLPKFEQLTGEERSVYKDNKEVYNSVALKGGHGLEFARSGTPNETWVPLIEKAYAKLHGDYAALNRGRMSEAVEDLTGGVSFKIRTSDILDKDRFWNEELLHANDHTKLFGVVFGELEDGAPSFTISGLYAGFAYSVVRVKEYKGKRFIMLRNPWGQSEWTGPWSDGSAEWTSEWIHALKELEYAFGDDGTFVMEYSDFLQTWTTIENTHIFDDSWVMTSTYVKLPPRPVTAACTYGEVLFDFDLAEESDAIIVLTRLDDRFFHSLAGNIGYGLEFAIYKNGDQKCKAFSPTSVFADRSIACKVHLEAGHYTVFPKIERRTVGEPIKPEDKEDWVQVKLSRVLTKKTTARALAHNFEVNHKNELHLPIDLEYLIKHKLEEGKQGEDKIQMNVDAAPPAQPSVPTTESIPGVPQQAPAVDDDDDDGSLFLGLHVYTKKHAVVDLVTAQIPKSK